MRAETPQSLQGNHHQFLVIYQGWILAGTVLGDDCHHAGGGSVMLYVWVRVVLSVWDCGAHQDPAVQCWQS